MNGKQEAVKIVITKENKIVAQCVNLTPIITEANSMEELDLKLKKHLRAFINYLEEIYNQKESFYYIEDTDKYYK